MSWKIPRPLDYVLREGLAGPCGPCKLPPYKTEKQVYVEVLGHLKSRGEFFRVQERAYYFDRVDEILMAVDLRGAELNRLLRRLELLSEQRPQKLVLRNLVDYAALAPERSLHRLSWTAPDWSATYLYASRTRMLKVTDGAIKSVPLGGTTWCSYVTTWLRSHS